MRFIPSFLSFTITLLAFSAQTAEAQQNRLFVAHYNVENLFDTIDDPNIQDEEFLPGAENRWTAERYAHKLEQLSRVIKSMNGANGPHILGLCEVENAGVVSDLARQIGSKKAKYRYVHFDSPDGRGIDVALLYQPKHFKVTHSKSLRVTLPGEKAYPTRDVLLVAGKLPNKQPVFVLVNHWPSRRGGEEASAPARAAAAQAVRKAVDSLKQVVPQGIVLVMGDFNDGPADPAPREVMGADWPMSSSSVLVNPFLALDADSTQGSYRYRGSWQYIDHISLSPTAFQGNGKVQYVAGSAGAWLQPWMLETTGKFEGNPLRTYGGKTYLGGFSDHLPVKIELEWRR